jgi:hypothetical protein
VPRTVRALHGEEKKLPDQQADRTENHDLQSTRRSLHGIAELVLAGPQYETCGSIRLRVTPGGFGTVTLPDLRVEGSELVAGRARRPLGGTFAGLARSVGIRARTLRDVYADGPRVDENDPVLVDPDALAVVMAAFARGDAALRDFAPSQQPVLWPEHFDLGITLAEVNYGVSPGDTHVDAPYAYVSPWHPRTSSFWNRPFGATRLLSEVPEPDELVGFFREGASRADTDPVTAPATD